MSLKKTIMNSAFWSGSTTFASFFITFGGGIVLARLIAPEVFGIFITIVATVELCGLVSSISTGATVIQNTTYPTNELAGTAFFINLMIVGVFGLIILFVGHFFFSDVILIFLILGLAKGTEILGGTHAALADRNFRFKDSGLSLLVINIVALITAISLAASGFGLQALATQYFFTKALFLLVIIQISKGQINYVFKRPYLRLFLSNGKYLVFTTSIVKIKQQLDKLIIASFLSAAAVGFYSRGRGLAEKFPAIMFSSIRSVLMASFAATQEQKQQSSTLFNTTAYLFFRVAVLINLVLASLANELIIFVYGSAWKNSSSVLEVSAIFGAIAPLLILARTAHYGSGRFSPITYISIFEALIWIITMLLGVQIMGMIGAAWALNITASLTLMVYIISLKRFIEIKIIRIFFLPSALAILCYITVQLLRANTITHFSNFQTIIIIVPSLVCVYGISIFIFEYNRLMEIWQMLKQTRG